MFINISPADSNLSETISTLNFGAAIKKIELGPQKKNVSQQAAAPAAPPAPAKK